jgi:erythronate-4-phosphate dehydrogenase
LADASLPGLEAAFPTPFKLTKYVHQRDIPDLLPGHDILLCRSTLHVNEELILNNPLKFVATASSGTDHLDHSFLDSKNITIIDAKGCNAVSVSDYVLSTLAYLDVNKLKSGFKAAIIGMGKVGAQVYIRLKQLGYTVLCYDPPKEIRDPAFQSCSIEDVFDCELLCVHAELQMQGAYPSFDLINADFLQALKPHCVIVNAARGGIVNEQAILDCKKPIIYCSDVYSNEPNINKDIVNKATLCTPHIAGHSLEAKFNAVTMVSQQLHKLLDLPLPNCDEPSKPDPISSDLEWKELVLSIYNPINETKGLKSATNLKETFIQLRLQHNYRHDFSKYFDLKNIQF